MIKIDNSRMGSDGDMQFFEVEYGDNRDEIWSISWSVRSIDEPIIDDQNW